MNERIDEMNKKKKDTAPETEEQEELLEETDTPKEDENEKPSKTKEEELEEKLKEQTDKYVRLFAEYDNYQKRSQREKDARYGDAVIDTVSAILSIGDNLDRALAVEVSSEDAVKFKEGVELVKKEFDSVLEKLGVSEIKAEGEQFDPNLHNAVMHIEDETTDDNTVVEEFMKGYIYKDNRVIRHSMVKVAN